MVRKKKLFVEYFFGETSFRMKLLCVHRDSFNVKTVRKGSLPFLNLPFPLHLSLSLMFSGVSPSSVSILLKISIHLFHCIPSHSRRLRHPVSKNSGWNVASQKLKKHSKSHQESGSVQPKNSCICSNNRDNQRPLEMSLV